MRVRGSNRCNSTSREEKRGGNLSVRLELLQFNIIVTDCVWKLPIRDSSEGQCNVSPAYLHTAINPALASIATARFMEQKQFLYNKSYSTYMDQAYTYIISLSIHTCISKSGYALYTSVIMQWRTEFCPVLPLPLPPFQDYSFFNFNQSVILYVCWSFFNFVITIIQLPLPVVLYTYFFILSISFVNIHPCNYFPCKY